MAETSADAAISLHFSYDASPLDAAALGDGAVVLFHVGDGAADFAADAAALNEATAGQLKRALAGAPATLGETVTLLAPHGLAASAVIAICAGDGEKALTVKNLRALGGAAAAALTGRALGQADTPKALVRLDALRGRAGDLDPEQIAAEISLGLELRAYAYEAHKSKPKKSKLHTAKLAPAEGGGAADQARGLASGVMLARDLVNAPANDLTPDRFVEHAQALAADGVEVEILDEAAMEKLGMNALLAVGRGSVKPSYVATMRWRGARDPDAAPACLVGKGVTFDTGGVSLKPAAGMEEMTMDMGGAAVVVGAMKALARRKSAANVVGLIGVVENMPDGDAQRPGDVVKAANGATIEVINTDAEGRLVLADVLWRAQQEHSPRWIVNLATLTGAMIVALGSENAGYFSNDDELSAALAAAASTEGEAVWRMPLGEGYDKLLKSRIADMKNVGGRAAGSITAAQFLQRFINPGQAWAHIDIAGVTLGKEAGPTWPKGATGWGVATLVRLSEDAFA